MGGDLWVFGYGSLLWNPGFAAVERRVARLWGWRRGFCMASIHHRGTEAAPGLVLALDAAAGAYCDGLAFRVAARDAAGVLAYLRGRELISSAYLETTQTVEFRDATRQDGVLTYVIEWSPYSFHTPDELAERHQRRESEIQRAKESVLNPELAGLESAGLSVETVVRHGKIAETLVTLAGEYGVKQIYIGKLGESRMHSMIFGSVTAALVQTSSVPVTVVP